MPLWAPAAEYRSGKLKSGILCEVSPVPTSRRVLRTGWALSPAQAMSLLLPGCCEAATKPLFHPASRAAPPQHLPWQSVVLSDRRAGGHQDIVPSQVDVCVHTAPDTLYNVQATQAVLGPCYSEFKVHQQDNISLARLNFSHLVSVFRQSSLRNL